MKARESGMPEEAFWQTFFDPVCVLGKLDCTAACRDMVEFGCGYGLFTVPAAQTVRGDVYALDIEPEMVAATKAKAQAAGLSNVRAIRRDFITDGTGLPAASVDYAMLFNILHLEEPVALLREAFRVLTPGATLGVMHWNYDPSTPRGPSLAIRPRPEQCRAWAEEAGFEFLREESLACCGYHYGLVFRRPGV